MCARLRGMRHGCRLPRVPALRICARCPRAPFQRGRTAVRTATAAAAVQGSRAVGCSGCRNCRRRLWRVEGIDALVEGVVVCDGTGEAVVCGPLLQIRRLQRSKRGRAPARIKRQQ